MANQYKNKVVYNGQTLIDLTADTAIASDVAAGKYFHLATGERVQGTASGGGGNTYTLTTVVPEQTFTPSDSNHQATITSTGGFEEGEQYLITFDGAEYASPCELLWGADYTIGDVNPFLGNYTADTVFPVGLIWEYGVMSVATKDTSQHTIKVEHIEFVDGPLNLIPKSVTANGTYSASSDNADGYSSVTVNVPSGSSMNVQVAQSTTRVASTSYTEAASLTCSTTGTYDVYWDCFRNSTSGTWGSQLYLDSTAYGSANTGDWSNYVQNNHLTGVQISAGQEVAVYVRSRGGSYPAYCGQLTIIQTA